MSKQLQCHRRLRGSRTNVGKIACEFERVNDGTADLGVTLDTKAKDTTEVSRAEQLLGDFVGWVVGETVIQNP